jgi:hypothetical protein
MELDDFISQSLLQIIRGVRAAKDSDADHKHLIAPQMKRDGGPDKEDAVAIAGRFDWGFLVSFDVAVSVSSKSDNTGKASIQVFGFGGAMAGVQSASANEVVSRIKFRVPVAYNTPPSQAR